MTKKKVIVQRMIGLLVLAFLLIFAHKISDWIYVSIHSEIKENISEEDCFQNPKMNDDTLFQIKTLSEENGLDFTKFTATALIVNQFDLQGMDIHNTNIKRYNKVYNAMQKEKGFPDYMKSIEAVLSDIRHFPVAMDETGKYLFSFEDSFGSARSYNGNYSHEGTDIMAEVNESGIYPIVSVSDGVVENTGWLPKGGYRIGIRGEHGGYFYYAHLHQNSITVNKGEKVKAGQIIGYMGDTGYGTEGTTGKFPGASAFWNVY